MTAANAVLISDQWINLQDLGIDTITLTDAATYLQQANPSVIGLYCQKDTVTQLTLLAEQQRQRAGKCHFFVVSDNLPIPELCQVVSKIRPAYVITQLEKSAVTKAFHETYNEYLQREQSEQLAALIAAKNDQLKRLSVQLENKVEERQKHLEESIKQSKAAENKHRILKQALVHIYQAQSLKEIEMGITNALSKEFSLIGAKIFQPGLSNVDASKNYQFAFRVSLKFGSRDFGTLLFLRNDKPFEHEDRKFLSQVAEAVALSIEKSFQLQRGLELRKQWEATFDAISDPLCLTDSQYNIIRVNKAYRQKVQLKDEDIVGNKCYKILFNRTMVCEGCHRGQTFQMRSSKRAQEVFNVYSNVLPDNQGVTYFQMYRDMTQSLNLERQVIESAKMAELGTISSSIAHELNNPIGGMLNFLQLMKMDLTGAEPYYNDILEIEAGTQKCKSIVQNLLGFSRKSDENEMTEIDLIEVIEQAIKITELKTRSIGISISRSFCAPSIALVGKFNPLAQAFRNILQNSQESIIEKRRSVKDYKGEIRVQVSEFPGRITIAISDDGLGIESRHLAKIFDPLFTTKAAGSHSGLGLTLAQQIVAEHKGRIEVSTTKDKKISFLVTLTKSEVES